MSSGPSLPAPQEVTERLLARVGALNPPIDLHRIVGFWRGLRIVFEELDGSGYLLPLGRLGAEIIVKNSDSPERQRFTIAHELGHWVLGLTWQKKTGQFRQPPAIRRDRLEKWCDSFAVNLLMPRSSLQEYILGKDGPTLIEFVLKAPEVFQVSSEAMFIRLWELCRIQVGVLRFQNSRRGWVLDRSYAHRHATGVVDQLLRVPEIREQLSYPFVFFTAQLKGREFLASGRRCGEGVQSRLILAIWHR